MSNSKSRKVYFLGGTASKDNLIGVLAFPKALNSDVEFTRFYMTDTERWVNQQFNLDLVSVCYSTNPLHKGWWLLGKRGEIINISSGKINKTKILNAGTGVNKLGYLKKIREINGQIYICGANRQVYKYTNNEWLSISDKIQTNKKVKSIFNDINGSPSGKELYVVGNKGEIFSYNGTEWFQIDSPTNEHLEGVTLFNDKIIIAGRNGTLIHGRENIFHLISNHNFPTYNYWDINNFHNKIFLSSSRGVHILEKNNKDEYVIENSPFPKHVGHKLSSNQDWIYSMGNNKIYAYNGELIQELECPDNL